MTRTPVRNPRQLILAKRALPRQAALDSDPGGAHLIGVIAHERVTRLHVEAEGPYPHILLHDGHCARPRVDFLHAPLYLMAASYTPVGRSGHGM